jgi:hypothetical protein
MAKPLRERQFDKAMTTVMNAIRKAKMYATNASWRRLHRMESEGATAQGVKTKQRKPMTEAAKKAAAKRRKAAKK